MIGENRQLKNIRNNSIRYLWFLKNLSSNAYSMDFQRKRRKLLNNQPKKLSQLYFQMKKANLELKNTMLIKISTSSPNKI